MNYKLSILICSLQPRLVTFALLAGKLCAQAKDKPVEVLWLGDNKTMKVSDKRDKLLSISTGEYIAFVDDDDMVSDTYIDKILTALESNPDCVTFECQYTNAVTHKDNHVYFSRSNKNENDDARGIRHRMVNHLNPVKREHAIAIGFGEGLNFGEDTRYAIKLWNSGRLRTDVNIPEILYHYQFNPDKSETHRHNPINYTRATHPPKPMISMDVVIVSNGARELNKLTRSCIASIKGENVNIIVVEKYDFIKYEDTQTIVQQEPFNYNECLNDGAFFGSAELICFSNNDVVFPAGFAHEVTQLMQTTGCDVLSVSDHRGNNYQTNISGFCFVMTRKAWNLIGKLNAKYEFYCADNVVQEQIKEHGLKELKSGFKVTHLCSVSHGLLDADTKLKYTDECCRRFNTDYDQDILGKGKVQTTLTSHAI